jgi:hypothetical protein
MPFCSIILDDVSFFNNILFDNAIFIFIFAAEILEFIFNKRHSHLFSVYYSTNLYNVYYIKKSTKMKKVNYFLLMLFLAVVFTNCKNDRNEMSDSTFHAPTATEFAEIRESFIDGLVQTKNFDATTGLDFTSPKGVKVNINYLTLNGQPVTGNVQLRYVELFDIGTMALANKPLVGRDYSGNVSALVTGGEFLLDVTQNGAELEGYASLQVPVEYTQGANPDDMTAWVMEDDSTIWEQGKGEIGRQGDTGAENYYYCWFPFCWTNIDWLYSLPGEKTEVRVKVPEGYNGGNCAVYAAYLTMPNTLAAFDVYMEEEQYFTEHYGMAPVGFQMFVIFVSADATTGQFVYATKLVTIAPNQYVVFTANDLHSGSIQQVIDAINDLYN